MTSSNLSPLAGRAGLAARLRTGFSGARNYTDTLGYKQGVLTFDDYYARYDRQDIASRIIKAVPSATWRDAPTIHEVDEEGEPTAEDTEFEVAWGDIEDEHKVWHYLERADRLSGIGHYSILLMGFSDGQDLSQPLKEGQGQKLLYLSPFSEKSAPIDSFDADPQSPRFGLPEYYNVDLGGALSRPTGVQGATTLQARARVHHSRVLHIADGLLEDDVYGEPRLRAIFNVLDDLLKVAGGSSEMFWQGAFMGFQVEVDPDHDLAEDDRQSMQTELDEYIHRLRRYIRTRGAQIQQLSPAIADPQPAFDILISLISSATGIPQRILLGSERGELASSQDETNWNNFVKERQEHFAEPMMLRPFIDRLIFAGVLPEPPTSYMVEWPNLFALSEMEEANVASTMSAAIRNYAPGGRTEAVMPISEFRELYLKLPAERPDELSPPPPPPEGEQPPGAPGVPGQPPPDPQDILAKAGYSPEEVQKVMAAQDAHTEAIDGIVERHLPSFVNSYARIVEARKEQVNLPALEAALNAGNVDGAIAAAGLWGLSSDLYGRTGRAVAANYDPDQPRDENGQWTDEGGGGDSWDDGDGWQDAFPVSEEHQSAWAAIRNGSPELQDAHMAAETWGFDSTLISESLRSGGDGGEAGRAMDAYFARDDIPTLQEDTVLYRALHSDGIGGMDSLQPGKVIHDRSFSSTVPFHDEMILEGFGDVTLRIHAPKGTPVLPLYSSGLIGDVEVEELPELVLNRGARFVVKSVQGRDVDVDLVYDGSPTGNDRLTINYDPNQPRDDLGRWTDTGGSASIAQDVATRVRELTRDGGASISLVDGSVPTDGYMVSMPTEYSRIVSEADFFDPDKGDEILIDYLITHREELSGDAYMGTWLNEGKVYLDVSENILDREEAIRLGVERNQKAIWDVKGQTEIDTGGTGE